MVGGGRGGGGGGGGGGDLVMRALAVPSLLLAQPVRSSIVHHRRVVCLSPQNACSISDSHVSLLLRSLLSVSLAGAFFFLRQSSDTDRRGVEREHMVAPDRRGRKKICFMERVFEKVWVDGGVMVE